MLAGIYVQYTAEFLIKFSSYIQQILFEVPQSDVGNGATLYRWQRAQGTYLAIAG